MVKITELYLNDRAVPFQKKYLETNGQTIQPGCYVFDTQDPNIVLKVAELPMTGDNVLSVKMELTSMPIDMAQDMMKARKHVWHL